MLTAAQLIERGARTGRLIPESQPMDPAYSERGLEIFNDILTYLGGAHVTIPYQSVIDFTINPGQEIYLSGNNVSYDINQNQIIDISDCWATMSQVRYPMVDINNKMYRNIVYPISEGIPAMYLLRIFNEYSQIILQPVPAQVMTGTLVCKQRLSEVTLTTSLDEIPSQWILALKFMIARDFRQYYAMPEIPEFNMRVENLIKDLMAENTVDVFVEKSEILTRNRFYYPYVLGFF